MSNTVTNKDGIEFDIDALATDVNGKADRDLSNITDNLFKILYPVGSIYITTASTCPLSTLIQNSTWTLVSSGRVLQGSDSSHSAGTTIEAGLPDHRHWYTSGSYWGGDPGERAAHWSHGNATTGSATGYFSYASEDNGIYGRSNTVQPPAYVVNIFRRTA